MTSNNFLNLLNHFIINIVELIHINYSESFKL
jgi:hypothetical protein